jgi:hypothetical protein
MIIISFRQVCVGFRIPGTHASATASQSVDHRAETLFQGSDVTLKPRKDIEREYTYSPCAMLYRMIQNRMEYQVTKPKAHVGLLGVMHCTCDSMEAYMSRVWTLWRHARLGVRAGNGPASTCFVLHLMTTVRLKGLLDIPSLKTSMHSL